MSRHDIIVRIEVTGPPAGVTMLVQKGRDELLQPAVKRRDLLSFEFPLTVDMSSGTPNFLGKFAQGPKDKRFIYVNSGTYAGDANSEWGRRAKLSLMHITTEQVKQLIESPNAKLTVTIDGTGRDGGAVCASIPVAKLKWKVAKD
jgi:hypothetical protein